MFNAHYQQKLSQRQAWTSTGEFSFFLHAFALIVSIIVLMLDQKLQRAIAESRGQSADRPLPAALGKAASVDGAYRSGDDSGTEGKGKQGEGAAAGATTSTKRKYRRHPKVSVLHVLLPSTLASS